MPPEIQSYLDFASEHRDVELRRPLDVQFADGEAFLRAATESTRIARERRPDYVPGLTFAYDVELLTALGLLAVDDTYEATPFSLVQAFYSQVEHKVVARTQRNGGRAFRGAVIVHELTHALQFDGLRLVERRGDRAVDSFGFQALVEGDATRIQDEFVASLPSRDRDEYDSFAVERRALTVDPNHPWQRTLAYTPYLVGAAYTRFVAANGGNEAVTALLRRPSTHDRWLLDPAAPFTRKPITPLEPGLPSGAEPIGASDAFGATPLFVTLAAFTDPRVSLRAVDEVFADGYRRYQLRGETCVAIAFGTFQGSQKQALADALGVWLAQRPRGAATLSDRGTTIQITSCPSRTKQTFDARAADAMFLVAQRIDGLRQAIADGLPRGRDRCFLNEFVNQYDLAALGPSAEQRTIAKRTGTRVREFCST